MATPAQDPVTDIEAALINGDYERVSIAVTLERAERMGLAPALDTVDTRA